MQTSDSTNGWKEPNGNRRPPTDESYPWNDNIHKNIVEECDRQDCTNWECKLEVLAHLLSIAEVKRAIATTYSHLDTRYIEATRHVHQVCEALDRHTQSWAMCMADFDLVVDQTERINQEVEQFLCLFVNQRQDNWYDWILIAKFAYND